MKKLIIISFVLVPLFSLTQIMAQSKIVDHRCTTISDIPESSIINSKNLLHIAYGHTSHGSQIITGMNNLDQFMGGSGLYSWNDGTLEGYLDIDDRFVGGDLGNPDRTTWAIRTRDYLNNTNNGDVNVIIWSWCGQVSHASEENINTYLELMNQLEMDFPSVKFIYMTGHLDGSGLSGNLHLRNEQIRDFCRNNDKYLFDFADIESYDPDGKYFGDKSPNDNCDYDTDGNGTRDGNWALEWQNSHTEGIDWYSCSSAHSQALNANQKAYAAWWLWSILAGWEGITLETTDISNINYIELKNNYPNPFNPQTTISYIVPRDSFVKLQIYNSHGQRVKTLINNFVNKGEHKVIFNAESLASGTYFYTINTGDFNKTKSMTLLK